MFYLNIVGFKDRNDKVIRCVNILFYLNIVGFKDYSRDRLERLYGSFI